MKRSLACARGIASLLVLWTTFTGLAFAQRIGGLRGVVTTSGPDGQPVSIPGATVLLQCENSTATSARTTTDETGSYSFTALVPGKCGLTVALTGFRETKKEIEIKADIGAELNV